jgi:iron complex transport system substrate-binding protein
VKRRPVATALAALLALAACGGGDDAASDPVATAAAASPAPATAIAATVAPATTAATMTSQPATAERIIPVNGDLAEVVYALGLGDQVVATDISATYPPAANDTPKIGYQRTLVAETILAHEPTVVLADDLAGPPEVLDQLEAAGVRVVRTTREDTIDSPARKIREVAAALGVVRRGEELVATLEAQLADAAAQAADAVAASGRPTVLALYLRGPNVQLAFGAGSGIDAVIDAAGGRDLGTAMGVVDSAELSIESVVAAAPDILLVTTTGLESVGGVDGLLAVPGIDQTPAARHRRVVAFEDQYLYGLGPRTGTLVSELVTAFHPDPSPSRTSTP